MLTLRLSGSEITVVMIAAKKHDQTPAQALAHTTLVDNQTLPVTMASKAIQRQGISEAFLDLYSILDDVPVFQRRAEVLVQQPIAH